LESSAYEGESRSDGRAKDGVSGESRSRVHEVHLDEVRKEGDEHEGERHSDEDGGDGGNCPMDRGIAVGVESQQSCFLAHKSINPAECRRARSLGYRTAEELTFQSSRAKRCR